LPKISLKKPKAIVKITHLWAPCVSQSPFASSDFVCESPWEVGKAVEETEEERGSVACSSQSENCKKRRKGIL
jgi:hypothetical protein